MTREEAMNRLSVKMDLKDVEKNINLINDIYDYFEGAQKESVQVMFSTPDADWGRVEAVILPNGEWIEIGNEEDEENETRSEI